MSGVCDYKMPDDKTCLDTIRDLMSRTGEKQNAGFDRIKPALPKEDPAEIYGLLPEDRAKPYSVKAIIERMVDGSEFTEYKEGYGKTMFCGYARIDGWSVGIVANQRELTKSKKGEMQFG